MPVLVCAEPSRGAGQEPAAPPEESTEPAILGQPAGFGSLETEDAGLFLGAGTALRQRPDLASPVLVRLDVGTEVEVLERRPAWARVRFGVFKGWVLTGRDAEEGAQAGDGPALPSLSRPAVDDSVRRARIERARELVGAASGRSALGPYELLTDVDDEALLDRLVRVASRLEEAFAGRYGLAAAAGSGNGASVRATVVLFSTDALYERYTAAEDRLRGIASQGHAGDGLAALSAESAPGRDVEALLIHEIGHLLTRRTLGVGLAPWLEEGLAEDLAYSRTARDGRLLPGTLRGIATRRLISGPRVQLGALAESPPALGELLDRPWQEFARPEGRSERYAAAAFLVRYLLDRDGSAEGGPTFRGFLAEVAAGLPSTLGSLVAYLGLEREELDADFASFLRAEAARAGV